MMSVPSPVSYASGIAQSQLVGLQVVASGEVIAASANLPGHRRDVDPELGAVEEAVEPVADRLVEIRQIVACLLHLARADEARAVLHCGVEDLSGEEDVGCLEDRGEQREERNAEDAELDSGRAPLVAEKPAARGFDEPAEDLAKECHCPNDGCCEGTTLGQRA